MTYRMPRGPYTVDEITRAVERISGGQLAAVDHYATSKAPRTPSSLRRPLSLRVWLELSTEERRAHLSRNVRQSVFDKLVRGHGVVMTSAERASLIGYE